MPITATQATRDKFLRALYELVGGDPDEDADWKEVARLAGLDEKTAELAFSQLDKFELVEHLWGDRLKITAAGIIQAERM